MQHLSVLLVTAVTFVQSLDVSRGREVGPCSADKTTIKLNLEVVDGEYADEFDVELSWPRDASHTTYSIYSNNGGKSKVPHYHLETQRLKDNKYKIKNVDLSFLNEYWVRANKSNKLKCSNIRRYPVSNVVATSENPCVDSIYEPINILGYTICMDKKVSKANRLRWISEFTYDFK
jgi:hypothetical protein